MIAFSLRRRKNSEAKKGWDYYHIFLLNIFLPTGPNIETSLFFFN
jgi:hypothetical protein